MLLLDSRVGSKELAAYLPPGSYQLTYLDAGDVALLGFGPEGPMTYPIVIERKTVYDLLNCFRDGRLNTQIQRMSGNYKQIYLVIEGRFRINKDNQHILVPMGRRWTESKITYGMIDNYLNTLVDEVHVKVKYSHTLQETAWQVWDIYTHCNTEKHSSHLKLDTTWEINPFMPPSFEKKVVAQLDGIGNEKADEIVKHFKSIHDMVNATEVVWREIPGIGKVLARSIVSQFWNKKNL